ncbi:MAG TPA: hypothetical protein VLW88_01770 [Hyphomicrobium sp.]|nr:hypothetical protein [Hyphomicrobium sp.]
MKATLKVLAVAALLGAAGTPAFAGDLGDALLIGAITAATDSGDDPVSTVVDTAAEVLDLD